MVYTTDEYQDAAMSYKGKAFSANPIYHSAHPKRSAFTQRALKGKPLLVDSGVHNYLQVDP